MDDKESEKRLMGEKWNNDWCAALENFWMNKLFCEESRLKLITHRLSLAVAPIAILPFEEKHLYAKYVALPDEAKDLQGENFKLLVEKKRPDGTYGNIPLAPGIFDSICIDNPYIWNKYLPLRQDAENVEDIDILTQKHEKNLFLSIADSNEEEVEDNKHEGQFIIPIFFGTIPVYCLMIVSNTITPEVFNARYLRETFDMIGRIGESILADGFVSPLWEGFCEKHKDKYAPNSDERKALYATLGDRILGEHNEERKFSSWIHSLPGHWVNENTDLNRITEDFKTEWERIKCKFIEGEGWYIKRLKELLDDDKIRALFTSLHDISENENETKIRTLKNNLHLFDNANNIEWFKKILSTIVLPDTEYKVVREAFYKLKTVLNKTDYKAEDSQRAKKISAGFVYFWPYINNIDKTLDCELGFEEVTDDTYNKYNYTCTIDGDLDIFEFTKTFYQFVKAFNTDYVPNGQCRCKITHIRICVIGKTPVQQMEIQCTLSNLEFKINNQFQDSKGNTSQDSKEGNTSNLYKYFRELIAKTSIKINCAVCREEKNRE